MRRREFLAALGAQAIWLGMADRARGMGENPKGEPWAASELVQGRLTRLGGMTLEELLEFHRREAVEEYLPRWTEYGVDWERGGYFTTPQEKGAPVEHSKDSYYQGRAIWVFAYAYNHFGGEARHLEAAEQGREFMLQHALRKDGSFAGVVDRRGKVISETPNIYGDMYMILGLAELSRATGNNEDLALAHRCAQSIMRRLTSPDYMFDFLMMADRPDAPGPLRLGGGQHISSSLTPHLRDSPRPATEQLARLCTRNIMERHWRPELGVFLELLDDQYEPYPASSPVEGARMVLSWHSLQAAWMVQEEALRRGERRLFRAATEAGEQTLKRTWVDGIGIVTLPDPGADPTKIDEQVTWSWGSMDEGLVLCLLTLEHLNAPWAIEYYNRMFALHNSRPEHWRRDDLLHHPRRLFYTVEILERMIAREGRVTGFL